MIAFERIPPLIWLVVGVPLAIAGAIATGAVALAAKDSYRAHGWVKARAEVQFTENTWLSDSRTRVSGSYRYEIAGQAFESDQLGLATFAAGILDWWPTEMYEYLKAARDEKRPIMVWIDPDEPARAVVDRELGAGTLLIVLPLAFALDGAAFLCFRAAWRALHDEREEEVIELEDSFVFSSKNDLLQAKWILTALWTVLSWQIAVHVLAGVGEGGKPFGYFVVVLPLMAIWFIWHCIVATYRRHS